MPARHRVKNKYKKIIADYNRLCAMRTPGGKRALSYEAIYERLANKYDLSEAWIERIVKRYC